jgi:hypothetical protein
LGDECPEDVSTDWCERFCFLENIDGIASRGREAPPGKLQEGVGGAETTMASAKNNDSDHRLTWIRLALSRKGRIYPSKTALRCVGHACFKYAVGLLSRIPSRTCRELSKSSSVSQTTAARHRKALLISSGRWQCLARPRIGRTFLHSYYYIHHTCVPRTVPLQIAH